MKMKSLLSQLGSCQLTLSFNKSADIHVTHTMKRIVWLHRKTVSPENRSEREQQWACSYSKGGCGSTSAAAETVCQSSSLLIFPIPCRDAGFCAPLISLFSFRYWDKILSFSTPGIDCASMYIGIHFYLLKIIFLKFSHIESFQETK